MKPLYVLKAPSGTLIPESVSTNRSDVVFFQFDFIAGTDSQFRSKYWKRLDAGNRAAKRRGWKIVSARIIEVK